MTAFDYVRLAVRLDSFAFDFDTYEYNNTVGTDTNLRMCEISRLVKDIENGNTADYISFLQSCIDELDEMSEMPEITDQIVRAELLIKNLQECTAPAVFTVSRRLNDIDACEGCSGDCEHCKYSEYTAAADITAADYNQAIEKYITDVMAPEFGVDGDDITAWAFGGWDFMAVDTAGNEYFIR